MTSGSPERARIAELLGGAALDAGLPPIGLFVKVPALEICELVADAGFTFVVIDTEHALLSVRDVYAMVVTYSNAGVRPLVRVTDHGYGNAQRYLDAGAAGILVPHVADAAQARQVVNQLRFPPDGTRGQGAASRAGRWGGIPVAEYRRRGREEVLRIVMIEDREGVENIEEILQVDGLSAIFIGPGDLRLSLGEGATSEEVAAMIDTAIGAAVCANVPVGTVVANPEQARLRSDQGCDFVLAGNDTGLIGRSLRELMRTTTAALGAQPVTTSGGRS